MNIKTVIVIGANGTMGANVSGIFASFGDAKVYLVCRDREKSEKAIERAVKSVRADSIRKNLIAADYGDLEKIVPQADLIFESAKEDLQVKLELTEKLGKYLKDDTFICTGTSGLSVTKLAESLPENLRKNYFGVHMFNPPYSMTLCEVIPTKYSDIEKKNELAKMLESDLLRTVVEVADSPAFLANRIGFQFINEALIFAEKYKDNGGIDYIDSILGSFTGRAMSPLVTADFVGLDIHKAIVDNLYENTSDYAHETLLLPDYVQKLIDENKLGKKSNCGLYKTVIHDDGKKTRMVYSINDGEYRNQMKYIFPFAEIMKKHLSEGCYKEALTVLATNTSLEAKICVEFLLKYILYSLKIADELCGNVLSADDVMATGFNWCPPVALLQALYSVADVKKLMKERLDKTILEATDYQNLVNENLKSDYDFRRFFKAK